MLWKQNGKSMMIPTERRPCNVGILTYFGIAQNLDAEFNESSQPYQFKLPLLWHSVCLWGFEGMLSIY